jgi:SagB-type dehydrogenase family enzyme
MRVKVAECAALFWHDGQLVWDDYLRHRQHALAEESESVLRWFSRWRELESARELGERSLPVAQRLLEAGVLVAEGSAEHSAEEQLLMRWGAWGSAARHFHFAARTPPGTRYSSLEDDAVAMRQRARDVAPPAIAKTHPDRPVVTLAGMTPQDDGAWPRAGLLDAVYGRRSTRRFAPEPLDLGELGAVLQVAGGIVDSLPDDGAGPAVFKTSPSAGGWHPVELYVEARSVDGLAPGVYHFAPTRGGLEALDRDLLGEGVAAALGGQPWLADAPALIVYTAVIERAQWRYQTGRAYRDVLIGLGHVSQTVLLTATAMGLGAVFATAVCDGDLERLIGCDPVDEIVLGVAALGRPAGS